MSDEEMDAIDRYFQEDEPATTNLNDYFDQIDKVHPKTIGKKRKKEEVEPVEAEEVFIENAKKYTKIDEAKNDGISSSIRYTLSSMIRGIDIALGYDGSAVRIMDDPSTSDAIEMMIVKDRNTRELAKQFNKYAPLVAFAGVLLSYHSYRKGWINSLENKIQNEPEKLKASIEQLKPGQPDEDSLQFMDKVLERK